MDERHERLLDSLPAVFRAADTSGDLRRLLAAFEASLFGHQQGGRPGIEEDIDGIARHFAPLPGGPGQASAMCPERFVRWLAGWVAFSPHALFSPAQLRRIVAGIVPLYTRRGTRAYLEQLLKLCFDEIDTVAIDDARAGLQLGRARVGADSVLGIGSPFRFRVVLGLHAGNGLGPALEERICAMIDFAKPAHTAYELMFMPGPPGRGVEDTAAMR